MLVLIKKICLKYPWITQLFLYGIIGGGSAVIDLIVFSSLRYAGINLFAANFIGMNIGICISFFLNANFNFKKTDKLLSRGVRFFCVGYCGIGLSMLVLLVGVEKLLFPEIWVKIFSVFFVAAVQFVLNKFISFRG